MSEEDVQLFNDSPWAGKHYLLIERSAQNRAICCQLTGNNMTQMPGLFTRNSLLLLGVNFESNSDVDARAREFTSGVDSRNNVDPAIEVVFHVLRRLGLLRPYTEDGGNASRNYHVIMPGAGRGALRQINPKNCALQMGLSWDGGRTRHNHQEAIRFVTGLDEPDPPLRYGFYLLPCRANCQVAYLGNLDSLSNILFTVEGLQSLRSFLEREYSRGGNQVTVYLGEHRADGLESGADPLPLLLVPQLNLPFGTRSPWEVQETDQEVIAALGDTIGGRIDKVVPTGKGKVKALPTAVQVIDLSNAVYVYRYIEDLSIV